MTSDSNKTDLNLNKIIDTKVFVILFNTPELAARNLALRAERHKILY